jgi:hypothetical protein
LPAAAETRVPAMPAAAAAAAPNRMCLRYIVLANSSRFCVCGCGPHPTLPRAVECRGEGIFLLSGDLDFRGGAALERLMELPVFHDRE